MKKFFQRWFFLLLLILGFVIFFYFDLQHYLTFAELKQHRTTLLVWTKQNYIFAVAIYMLIYITAIAFSFPGALFLTLVGGFLFGPVLGTIYVVISATIGATCIFLAVKLALKSWMRKRASSWIEKMRAGFQKNALSYLLTLRLMPIFPFWVINLVSALLGVRTSIFIIATFFGIIPGSFIYTFLGSGLGKIFDSNQTPHLNILFEPQIIIPLFLLALLSLLASFYKKKKRKKT